eukprot:4368930-Amphidinium_carterae.1
MLEFFMCFFGSLIVNVPFGLSFQIVGIKTGERWIRKEDKRELEQEGAFVVGSDAGRDQGYMTVRAAATRANPASLASSRKHKMTAFHGTEAKL